MSAEDEAEGPTTPTSVWGRFKRNLSRGSKRSSGDKLSLSDLVTAEGGSPEPSASAGGQEEMGNKTLLSQQKGGASLTNEELKRLVEKRQELFKRSAEALGNAVGTAEAGVLRFGKEAGSGEPKQSSASAGLSPERPAISPVSMPSPVSPVTTVGSGSPVNSPMTPKNGGTSPRSPVSAARKSLRDSARALMRGQTPDQKAPSSIFESGVLRSRGERGSIADVASDAMARRKQVLENAMALLNTPSKSAYQVQVDTPEPKTNVETTDPTEEDTENSTRNSQENDGKRKRVLSELAHAILRRNKSPQKGAKDETKDEAKDRVQEEDSMASISSSTSKKSFVKKKSGSGGAQSSRTVAFGSTVAGGRKRKESAAVQVHPRTASFAAVDGEDIGDIKPLYNIPGAKETIAAVVKENSFSQKSGGAGGGPKLTSKKEPVGKKEKDSGGDARQSGRAQNATPTPSPSVSPVIPTVKSESKPSPPRATLSGKPTTAPKSMYGTGSTLAYRYREMGDASASATSSVSLASTVMRPGWTMQEKVYFLEKEVVSLRQRLGEKSGEKQKIVSEDGVVVDLGPDQWSAHEECREVESALRSTIARLEGHHREEVLRLTNEMRQSEERLVHMVARDDKLEKEKHQLEEMMNRKTEEYIIGLERIKSQFTTLKADEEHKDWLIQVAREDKERYEEETAQLKEVHNKTVFELRGALETIKTMTEELAACKIELDDARAEAVESKEKMESAAAAAHRAEVDTWRVLEEKRAAVAELESSESRRVIAEDALKVANERLASSANNAEDYLQKCTELKAKAYQASHTASTLQDDLRNKNMTNSQLIEELSKASDRVAASEAEVKRQDYALSEAMRMLDEHRAQLEITKAAQKNSLEQISKLQMQVSQLRGENEFKADAIKRERVRLDDLQKEKEIIESQLSEARKSDALHAKEARELQAKLDSLKREDEREKSQMKRGTKMASQRFQLELEKVEHELLEMKAIDNQQTEELAQLQREASFRSHSPGLSSILARDSAPGKGDSRALSEGSNRSMYEDAVEGTEGAEPTGDVDNLIDMQAQALKLGPDGHIVPWKRYIDDFLTRRRKQKAFAMWRSRAQLKRAESGSERASVLRRANSTKSNSNVSVNSSVSNNSPVKSASVKSRDDENSSDSDDSDSGRNPYVPAHGGMVGSDVDGMSNTAAKLVGTLKTKSRAPPRSMSSRSSRGTSPAGSENPRPSLADTKRYNSVAFLNAWRDDDDNESAGGRSHATNLSGNDKMVAPVVENWDDVERANERLSPSQRASSFFDRPRMSPSPDASSVRSSASSYRAASSQSSLFGKSKTNSRTRSPPPISDLRSSWRDQISAGSRSPSRAGSRSPSRASAYTHTTDGTSSLDITKGLPSHIVAGGANRPRNPL